MTEPPTSNASQAKPDQLNAYWNAVAYVTALLGWHKREAEFVGDKKHWPCEVSEQALECLNEIDVKLLDPAFPLQDLVSTALSTADNHLELANDWERRFDELQSQHDNLRERNKELMANCDAKDVKIRELTCALNRSLAPAEDQQPIAAKLDSERKRFAAEIAAVKKKAAIAESQLDEYMTGGGMYLLSNARTHLQSLHPNVEEPQP